MQRYNADTGQYEDVPESPYQNFDKGSQYLPGEDPTSKTGTSTSGSGGGGGGQSNEDWVRQQYQQNFNGRAPTQSEMTSELDNLNRYGRDSGPYGGVAAQIAKRATNTPGAGDSGGGGLSSAYGSYLGGNQQPAASPASPAAGQSNDVLSYLKEQQTRQDSERAAMRALLMGKIGEASAPVDVNSPGIKEILAAQRLAGQRNAERQQSRLAANLATQGLQSSGAADTGTNAIGQQRGENEVQFTGETLNRELQQKRAQLSDLLHMAMSSGDAESARTLQAQLQELDRQQQNQHFNADLGFRQSSFMDDLGYRLMALQLGANQNAFNAFQ